MQYAIVMRKRATGRTVMISKEPSKKYALSLAKQIKKEVSKDANVRVIPYAPRKKK